MAYMADPFLLLAAGLLPVMEIVFLLEKTHVEQDKLIQFETVQGMPAAGEAQQNGHRLGQAAWIHIMVPVPGVWALQGLRWRPARWSSACNELRLV